MLIAAYRAGNCYRFHLPIYDDGPWEPIMVEIGNGWRVAPGLNGRKRLFGPASSLGILLEQAIAIGVARVVQG
jgi:hypothetical protein